MSKHHIVRARHLKIGAQGVQQVLPPGAHISSPGKVQMPPARPAVQIQWRVYPGSKYCWQIVAINGEKVYILSEQTNQPDLAASYMQQVTLALSEQEADAKHKELLEQQRRPQLWRPGMPMPEGIR